MFKKIDLYIIRELLPSFFFGITTFTAILAGSTILIPLMSDASKWGIPIQDVVKLFIYHLPSVIVFTFPMAMLLATVMAFGRLNSDLELTAFRSAGISFFRLVMPVMFVGLVVSLVTIVFNESIVPKATHSAENLVQTFKNKDTPTLKKNINLTEYDTEGRPLRILNVIEVENGHLKGVTILEYENGELVRAIKANSGQWLPGGGWEFYDGIMHNFTMSDKRKAILIEFKKEFINIKSNPIDLVGREKFIEEMSAKELRKHIDMRKSTGQKFGKELTRYHMRFSVPFASLIFAILGASVGVRPQRSTSAIGFGLSLLVIMIYYILLGISVGIYEVVPPVLAAWIPNTVVGLVGLFMLLRASQK